MKRTVVISALTVLAIAGTTLSASAHEGGKRGHQGPRVEFSDLDANADGQLTAAELDAHAAARFAEADTNGDGVLNAEELAARSDREVSERMEKRIAKMIEKMDANDDGGLSLDEMQRRDSAEMIAKLDTNEDGTVSAEEFEERKGDRKGKKRFKDGKKKGADQTSDDS